MVHVTRTTAPERVAETRGVDHATAVDAILTELGSAIRELRCASTQGMVRTGVSMAQMHVLWLLQHQGEMPMNRLADLLDISFSNATGLVDRMEERGYVERVRVPDDRRLVLVRPAAAGRQALEDNEGLKRDRMRAALDRLNDRQLDRALASFRDFRAAIQAELGTSGPHQHHFEDRAD